MKTNIIYITTVAILCVPVFLLNAQTGRESVRPVVQEVRQAIQDARADMRANARATNTATSVKVLQTEIRAKVELKRAEFKARIEELKLSDRNTLLRKLDAQAKARVEQQINAIYAKLTQRINRLSRVDSEITKRINTLALSASSSSAVLASLRASQKVSADLLAKARIDVDAARTTSLAETSTTTKKEVFRALVSTSEASIKAAAESYRKLFVTVVPLINPVTAQ